MPDVAVSSVPRLERAEGRARVAFSRHGDGTSRLADLWQEGSCKVRLPRAYGGAGPVAVLINSAGGVTGGDRLTYEAVWGAGTRATVTTQAAERIYRRSEGAGYIGNRLEVGAGATAFWLPQETILFDGSGLCRQLDVSIAGDATLVAVEAIVFGRTAMGEEIRRLDLSDDWRVRRDGRLVYADALRLSGDARDVLKGKATGGGARAVASLLLVAPDAETRLAPARQLIENRAGPAIEVGASAFDGLLSIRLLAQDGRVLRAMIEPLIESLTGEPLPRAWSV